jgi:hypothetical protein
MCIFIRSLLHSQFCIVLAAKLSSFDSRKRKEARSKSQRSTLSRDQDVTSHLILKTHCDIIFSHSALVPLREDSVTPHDRLAIRRVVFVPLCGIVVTTTT